MTSNSNRAADETPIGRTHRKAKQYLSPQANLVGESNEIGD